MDMDIVKTKAFERWHKKLKDKQALSLIAGRLERLEEGHFGDCIFVGGNVSELRIHYGSDYRIYFSPAAKKLSSCWPTVQSGLNNATLS